MSYAIVHRDRPTEPTTLLGTPMVSTVRCILKPRFLRATGFTPYRYRRLGFRIVRLP